MKNIFIQGIDFQYYYGVHSEFFKKNAINCYFSRIASVI